MDLIVSGIELMRALGKEPGQSQDSPTLDSIDDFTNTFTHYFTKGSAAERTFTNPKDFSTIVKVAETVPGREVSHINTVISRQPTHMKSIIIPTAGCPVLLFSPLFSELPIF